MKELIDEVLLSLGRNLRNKVTGHFAILGMHAFIDKEQAHFRVTLHRHIREREILVIAKPTVQTFLANIVAILLKEFGHVAYQDVRLTTNDGICKDHLRTLIFQLLLLLFVHFPFSFRSGCPNQEHHSWTI